MKKTNQAAKHGIKTIAGLKAGLIALFLVSSMGFVHAVNITNKLSFATTTYNTGGLLDLRVGDSAILPNNIKVVYDEAIDAGSNQVKAKFKLYDLNGNSVGEVTVGKNELTNAVAANIQVKDIPLNAVPGLIKVDINALCTPQYPCDAIATAVAEPSKETIYNEFMQAGDQATASNGYKIKLDSIAGFAQGVSTNAVPASFIIYDANGNEVDRAKLSASETYDKNGLVINVRAVYTAQSGLAYAQVSIGAQAKQGEGGSGYVPVPTSYAVTPSALPNRIPNAEVYDNDFPTMPSDTDEQGLFSYTNTLYPGWNLFSIPFDNYREAQNLNGERGQEISGPEFTASTCSDSAKIYWYNAQQKKYVKMGSVADFKSKQSAFSPGGTAYWMKTSEACTIQTRGNRLVAFNAPFYVALEPGWSSFGAPAQSTAFEKVKNNCVVKSGPWKYNTLARKYEKVQVLQPGEGYFVKSSGKCTLSLPPTPPLPPKLDEKGLDQLDQPEIQPTPAASIQATQVPALRTETSTTVSSGTATRMKIGDKILEPDGYVIELIDVAGFFTTQEVTNTFPAVFAIYDSAGNEVNNLTLQIGGSYDKNGVYIKLIATSPSQSLLPQSMRSAYADVIVR